MSVIQIDGVRVHTEVLTTKFACDYQVCKGSCCYIDGGEGTFEGCSVTPEEREHLEKATKLKKSLGLDSITYSSGGEFFIRSEKGPCVLNTPKGCLLKDERYTKILGGIPIGCALYPLTVDTHTHTHLRVSDYYREYGICDCAFARGNKEGTYLVEFCKDALIRQFGEDFYNKLLKQAHKFRTE